MHCLQWWLPIFLLPLPAGSPYLLILFIISYFLRTKPCAYCSIIILGLLFSTCSFYHFAQPISGLVPTQSLQAERAVPIEMPATTTTTTESTASSSPITNAILESSPKLEQQQQPSSCWIDLTHTNHGRMSGMNLGRWSAHIWRRYPSVLSQIGLDENFTSSNTSSWKQFFSNGIFIGINDIGFRLKLMLE